MYDHFTPGRSSARTATRKIRLCVPSYITEARATSFTNRVKMFYRVAEFPEGLATPDGNILVAAVYGYLNSRKRKRSELAVAVDCESVNLYDVQLTPPDCDFLADIVIRFGHLSFLHLMRYLHNQSLLAHHVLFGCDRQE